MRINRALLDKAAEHGTIRPEQVEVLWTFLSEQMVETPSFRFTHILYYFGGLIAIGAMTLFMNLGWERFGGWGLFFISLAYAGTGIWLTEYLLNHLHLSIPAGISAAFVVALTPLAIYGLQAALGFWIAAPVYHEIHMGADWRWIFMELGTLAAGAAMLWRYRLPFLVMPVAVTLWYMSMDLTPFLFGTTDVDWRLRELVSMWFGLLMLLLAFWLDLRTRHQRDYPFWLYLFGMLAFWCGLSLMKRDSELDRFIYLCINLVMIVTGSILSRRIFVIFGGLGAAGYLGHLAYTVFKDSLLFPFALTVIGFGVICLGILWQRHEKSITSRLRSLLPAALQELVDHRQL